MPLHLYRHAFSNLNRNIWILSLAMFINRSGSMVLLFTTLYMTRDLHFSIAEAGFVMSFYGMGSVLGSYLGGWLTDRKNHFDIMVSALISSGLILLSLLVITTPAGMAAVIFIYALAADSFRPANAAAIAEYSTPENRTRSVGLMRLAVNLGFAVGPAVGGFVALYLGYRWLFVIDACTGFLAALMLFLYLPRPATIPGRHKNEVLADSSTSAYRDLRYLFFIALVAVYGTIFFQIFASIPQYFKTVSGYDEDRIGLLMALNGILVVIIEMPLIAKLEKSKKIFRFIVIGVFCLPAAFALLYFGQHRLSFAILYTFVITLSEIFAMPFMMNYALSRPKKERQGQYSALYSIAYGIATIAAPSLGLGIADRYGFDRLFVILIVSSLFLSLGFLWMAGKEKTEHTESAG
ncbi:MAG TPA: MFS transporter [Bacteroidia bacterium]|nr:MFS transporter [Bacteroidia bacterium]HRU61272.1 MFS transporter [Bacteroidia bacterium]